MSLLAFDIGSSRCKAVVFSVTGEMLAQHSCTYTPAFPAPSRAEIDPGLFWQAVRECSHAVCRNLSDPVRALCLSSHGETFVPVNGRNEPIGPAILNQDNRAIDEALWLEKTIGRRRLFEITGLIAHPMYPVPKILWLRQHRAKIFDLPVRFITAIGFILSRLGLPPYIDYSLASRYLAFDIQNKCWSKEILAATELNVDCLPVLVAAGTIAGELDGSAAEQLALPRGTMVVMGGHDQPCGALGVGGIGSGRVADSMGTYECLAATSEFITLAYFPSGIMMKWFHDLLYGEGLNKNTNPADAESLHYATLERDAPADPSGLCITPNLIGTCNPDFNPHARGVIWGLSANSTRSQIYKGILEGLACELAQMTDILAHAVGDFRDVYVTGGGSRSALGLRLRASLSGRNLHLMECPESVCLGAAILAGVACGEYASLREAVDLVVRDVSTISPDAATAAAYTQQKKQYRRVRSMLPENSCTASSKDSQEER
jgi:xylulokinase